MKVKKAYNNAIKSLKELKMAMLEKQVEMYNKKDISAASELLRCLMDLEGIGYEVNRLSDTLKKYE